MDEGDDGGIGNLPPSYFQHHQATTGTSWPSAMFSSAAASSAPVERVKRKRGRPRKYGVSSASNSSAATVASSFKRPRLSPVSAQLLSSSPSPSSTPARKKTGPSASASSSKKSLLAAARAGDLGKGFTTHIIKVADGEDVTQKIISFMQQSKRAVCVLSASGFISSALLRQPASYGGYVTYEGKYDIASISGSFLPAEDGVASGNGGLSVCLAGTDGCLVGGGVGGHLLAAGIVQVVAGSFLIDSDKNSSAAASRTPQESASKQLTSFQTESTLVAPTPLRPTADYEKIITSRLIDDHQNLGGTSFLVQSREMDVMASCSSKDGRGRQDELIQASDSFHGKGQDIQE